MIDLILENEEVLKKLYKGGLLSPKVFFYRNLYLDYDANIKMGVKNRLAISRTAKKFGICEVPVAILIVPRTTNNPHIKALKNVNNFFIFIFFIVIYSYWLPLYVLFSLLLLPQQGLLRHRHSSEQSWFCHQ
ncbi:unnamed protein product [marine sediment metagenome]|uniref:Uncharacterized protein n=1 Tax=marine sediment metagenome TaxID=412755 RepID=X1MWV7_9ZZZZ